MFGYVRVRKDTLPAGAIEKYEAIYCGLCHTMGKHYGGFSRLFLNYDFAFLAMLLAPPDACETLCYRQCPLHPIQGKVSCNGGDWLMQAAEGSVILTYWKLRDTVNDESFISGLPARLLSWGLWPGYRKARKKYSAFETEVRYLLTELRDLELAGCTSIDETADKFAQLLCAAALTAGNGKRERILRQLLYHVGRWIYLIDAVDDLSEDRRAGRYNPVAARFQTWSAEDKQYLRDIMDHSLTLAGAAFQLLEKNPWAEVTENILYSGLPGVEELVFTGKWREYQKDHRRNDL